MEKNKNRDMAQKILDAALALWSEKGYANSTMRELSKRIGMGVSSLYFYFESKEDIVQYLYSLLNDRARDQFRAQDQGETDLGVNFKTFMTIKLALLGPHRSALAVILREAVDPASRLNPMSPDSAKVLEDNLAFLRELTARAHPKNTERQVMLARLLWFAHLAVLMYWLHDRSIRFTNTYLVIDKIAGLTKLTAMLQMIPGVSDWLTLLGDLIQPHQPKDTEETHTIEAEEKSIQREVDVAVIGAGPIGILYACFVKQQRPKTRVLVLDRADEPGHKIGESTLSGFCKAMRSIGIRQEILRQLFYLKNGLGFLHVDESLRDVTKAPEYILETFDETFQVERRVLDSLLIANAQRLGVEVLQGARVDMDRSTLSEKGNTLFYTVGPQDYRVRCSVAVDATGPAGTLSHKLGMRTDEGVPFQNSAVWTYFTGIRPLAGYTGWPRKSQFVRDQYTQHLCFREGWMWYIPIVSWQGTPTANLNRALDRLLRPGRSVPTRQELVSDLACPVTDIVSVGITVRSDRDSHLKDDPRATFDYYAKKYPAIAQVLEGAKPLENYYGTGQTYMSRMNFRGHARRVTGDGWLLIGDAAFFIDPLISPGLTGGTAGAFQAAAVTVKALDAGHFTDEAFTDYERFSHQLYEALERDNELVYMSFNHPEALALVQRFQEIDARRHFLANKPDAYGMEDTNVWGILEPAYQTLQKAAWTIMREEELVVAAETPIDEQSARDYERMVTRLRELLGPYVDSHQDMTPYVRTNRTHKGEHR